LLYNKSATSPQQINCLQEIHDKLYNKSNESIKCSYSISWFVGQITDNTTMVVDKVKYATHVQQGVFTTTSLQQIHNKSM